jgi:hypothetical protein
MADIFLSYSRKNASVVRELVAHLEKQDWSVFWDRDMMAGNDFERHLEKELGQAKAVLVVWSQYSVESSWVRAEANDALERQCYVPIRMDNSILPLIFRSTETIDLTRWPMVSRPMELRKMVLSLKTVIEKKSDALPESDAEFTNLQIRDDPSLSVRIARHVLDSLENNSSSDQAVLQLKIETAVADAALAHIGGEDKQQLLITFLAAIVAAVGGDSGLIRYQDREFIVGDVDDSLELMQAIRKTSQNGIQPISLVNTQTEFALRVVSNDGGELIVLLDRYVDISQELIIRLRRAFSILIS